MRQRPGHQDAYGAEQSAEPVVRTATRTSFRAYRSPGSDLLRGSGGLFRAASSTSTYDIRTTGGKDELRTISFPVPDARISNAHANEIDATEAGAYGVSLAAVEAVAGLFAVRRAETLTGADWYIAPAGVSADDLEDCIRLEVSGTSSGGSSEVSRRLQEKIAQTARGKSNLPAMAAVVGFKVLEIAIAPLGAEV
jgi:hypothetical protein